MITPEEFAEQMKTIAEKCDKGLFDEEVAHGRADWLMEETLTALGYSEG